MNLASFLLGARDISSLPVFRTTAFATAYRLTGWPHQADPPPGARYAEALSFLDAFADQCRDRGAAGLRDRLDAQGLLWQVLAGQTPTDWGPAESAAYQRFIEGETVDELGELVEQFRTETGYTAERRALHEADRAELVTALTPESLADPDVPLLRRLVGSAYGARDRSRAFTGCCRPMTTWPASPTPCGSSFTAPATSSTGWRSACADSTSCQGSARRRWSRRWR